MATGPEQEIRRRILQRGQITFCEFMDLALYWPEGGYYSSRSISGTEDDFFTAPGAHPAFGALIAVQMYQMWNTLGQPHPFWIIEAGAASGLLCHDLVSFSEALPTEFCRALRYLCLDRSPATGHEAQLPASLRAKLHRVVAHGVPLKDLVGCVLSNELLDSFPVHRVAVQDGHLQEIYVTLKDNDLVESIGPPSNLKLERRLNKVGAFLAEGWQGEVNLALDDWITQVARALDRGYLLTFDYGRSASQLYSAQRRRGTLTTFRHNLQTDDPFHHIGAQDITAQVDFTAMETAGVENGLQTVGSTSQRQFLFNLGMEQWTRRLVGVDMSQAERDANRMGMQQLVQPGGMGDFRVLAQAKGVECSPLWGLQRSAEAESTVESLLPPRLTPLHMPLLQARYPHQAWSWEHLWPFSSEPPLGQKRP